MNIFTQLNFYHIPRVTGNLEKIHEKKHDTVFFHRYILPKAGLRGVLIVIKRTSGMTGQRKQTILCLFSCIFSKLLDLVSSMMEKM